MLLAQGIKVKDDPKKLKKLIKAKEKKKKKSQKEWAGRVKEQKQGTKEKQQQRTKNMKEHKDGRLDRLKASKGKCGAFTPHPIDLGLHYIPFFFFLRCLNLICFVFVYARFVQPR